MTFCIIILYIKEFRVLYVRLRHATREYMCECSKDTARVCVCVCWDVFLEAHIKLLVNRDPIKALLFFGCYEAQGICGICCYASC